MRYGAKVDTQHGAIRDGLRQAGVVVMDGARWGRGAPDLLAWTRHTGWIPLEVKTRRSKKKLSGLTKSQGKIHAQAPIAVVETLDAALGLFGMR
jgi:hypothetical protein